MTNVDLRITSIPNHKSQLLVARLIVGSDRTISMQRALEMTANPPVVLRNLNPTEAKDNIVHFKAFGIAFNVSESQDGAPSKGTSDDDARWGPPLSAANDLDNAVKDLLKPDTPADDRAKKTKPADRARPAKQAFNTPAQPPVHSAGNAGNGHIANAHGSIDEEKLDAMEKASKRKSILVVSVVLGVFFLLGMTVYLLPESNKHSSNSSSGTVAGGKGTPKPKSASAGGSGGARGGADGGGAQEDSSADHGRNERHDAADRRQQQQANAYLDSAQAVDGDLMKRIAFYKLAISFNRYNLPAWQGLLQAYLELAMTREARETERQIIEIFGNEVMSVNTVVNKSYGELTDARKTADGTYMVEYRSRKSGKNEIMRDVFEMSRAVRTACGCKDITILATTGAGKRLIAHIPDGASVLSFADFSRQAYITWQD